MFFPHTFAVLLDLHGGRLSEQLKYLLRELLEQMFACCYLESTAAATL